LSIHFGRAITYLRVSVTDRCDLRCIYCMSERMRFLPRNELLSIEELDQVVRGVRQRAACADCASPAASPWCGAAS
jgi:molybdenum cofactor biosynthesis enzyme MoaA